MIYICMRPHLVMVFYPPDHGFRCRPDLCAQETSVPPREQLGKFWCDSLVHDAAALDLLTEVTGKVSYRAALDGVVRSCCDATQLDRARGPPWQVVGRSER